MYVLHNLIQLSKVKCFVFLFLSSCGCILNLGAVWVDLCVVQGAASKLAENVGGERHEVCRRLADELLEHLDWLLLAEALTGDDGVHGLAAGRGDSTTAARSEGVLQLRKIGGDGGLGHVGRDLSACGSRLVGDRVRVARRAH